MSWYYNTESGALTSSGAAQGFFQDIQSAVGLGAGWHKLNIPATDTGTQAAAEAVKEFPTGKAPTTSVGQQVVNATPGVSQVAGAATDVNTFLSRLTSPNLWLRVGEFILGAILILSGTMKLTGNGGDLGDMAKLARVVK
jgi:hypothetical protein